MSIAATPEAAAAPHPMRTRPAAVRRVVRETGDTVTLHLEPPGGSFDFTPGQFNMLYLFGAGEVAISLSGDPSRREEIVHTVRGVGGVTRPVVALRKGGVLGVRGPFGRGWPVEEARGKDVVLVAGGIGLAPLRPVVHAVLARRKEFGRLVVLYGARQPRDLLYRRELDRWSRRKDLELFVTVDAAEPSWAGEVGVVTRLMDRLPIDPARTAAMICGPEVMIRFTARELAGRGVGDESLWISLERNMQCAVGHCGRCQLGPAFLCKDGPVFRFDRIAPFFGRREL